MRTREICKDCEHAECLLSDCEIYQGVRDERAVDRYQEEKEE